jgi:hypothetical protein
VYSVHNTSNGNSSTSSGGRYPDSGKIRRPMSGVLDISVARETTTIQTFRQSRSSTSDRDAVTNTMEMSSLNERDDSIASSVKKQVTSVATAAV